jgi:ribonuclease HI
MVVGADLEARPSSRVHGRMLGWSRPPVGTVKLNIDGAYIDQTGVVGAGMILRHDYESIVFSACWTPRFCSSALESELSACLEGVSKALGSAESIIIETDCMELIHLIKARSRDSSSLGHLVADLKDLLSSPRIIEVKKIHRDQNSASHELARFGMLQDRTDIWFGTAHVPLLSCILRDCNITII